ncbi:MAG: hypothetical protein HY746_10000 [Elusimicrobia bacterium]|nr:hypothetical protein [Elusimicrobiota bacterium]
METKTDLNYLLVQTVKLLILLVALTAMGFFMGLLPFAKSLPVLGSSIFVIDLWEALLSLTAIIIIINFAGESKPVIDRLICWIPQAGKLAGLIIYVFCVLFAYYAFQPVILPFIPEAEWIYQTIFLILTITLLVKAGLLVYRSSDEISRFLVSLLNPYKEKK